ncbi:MAG: glycosyltransferase [Nanoarchaeota archaeon]|nr:glycosyltransferase [Nanoarchaeota archaeon]MBU1031132.1 glycosyltransferase [Nanoarchaeota archaeon]MBU1850353.1 glycosyltransferase [Nanoarchaeota archaeon]
MDVSIGVMAYNEEGNINSLLNALLRQETKQVFIKEIIVVSSGSTDNTCKIVKSVASKEKKVKLIEEKTRKGKSHAINLFLKKAKSDILILISADTIPEKQAIENLCKPLKNKSIGIVGGKPLPIKTNKKFFNFLSSFLWQIHHEIALLKPKFGELIAFKKVISSIPSTSVDEEEIASLIFKKKFQGVYSPKAKILNKGPQNISDFLSQRRRIFAGHLSLRKKEYTPTTMNLFLIIKIIFLKTNFFWKNPIYFIFACLLEIVGRLLGVVDFYLKKQHVIWKIARSTKKF